MPANMLIEWTKMDHEPEGSGDRTPDVTVFTDGRVRLGPRLGAGATTWHQLSQHELDTLGHFVFGEQGVMDIDGEALLRDVNSAAAHRRKAAASATVELSTAPQMDAGTTLLRAAAGGRTHEVGYYDLFGDAQRYPEVEALQRLRAIELRLLEIAEACAAHKR